MSLILIGAGNHCKAVIDIVKMNNEKIIGIVDDDSNLHESKLLDIPVIGNLDKIEQFDENEVKLIITIGKPYIRKTIYENFLNKGYTFANAVHPNTCISNYACLGNGVIINSGTAIHPDVKIKDNVIIGLNSTISHDSLVDLHSHISPGVNIAGGTTIGSSVDIGINASIIQNIKIGDKSIIGAGAVVVDDIQEKCTAVGVPAKPIKFH
nr:acetyltransferase [Natranaerobius trueperi]